MKTFLVPTSDPTLRLEASIICGILLNVPPPEPLRTRETYTFIINNLFEALNHCKDEMIICSILIVFGVLAEERTDDLMTKNIITVLQTLYTTAHGSIHIIREIVQTISCLFKWKWMRTPLLLLPLLSTELHSCDVKTVSHAASAISYLLEHLSPRL